VLAMIASTHHDAMKQRDRRLLAEETTRRLFRRIDDMRKNGAPKMFSLVTYDDGMTH
jgi:hypothetical protein